MQRWFDTRSRESLLSAGILIAGLGVILLVASSLGLASDRLLKFGCVNVIAGIGLGLFSGTTGNPVAGPRYLFGVGAYVSTWFTLPTAMKAFQLAAMPEFILKRSTASGLRFFPRFCRARGCGSHGDCDFPAAGYVFSDRRVRYSGYLLSVIHRSKTAD